MLADAPDTADDTATVTVRAGDRAFTVSLRRREVDGVVASCGQAPKREKVWVAEEVEPDVD